jgi:DNA-binding MarR family transcriptional regulator
MTRWLNSEQQLSWRAWLAANALITDALQRDLQAQHGLTLADYEILVRLSESPERMMRMSDLAEQTLASRSRLSHQIDRLAKHDLVLRVPCPNDKRGYFAVLTDAGFALLEQAAPDHVESVRKHLVDVLSPAEFEALGRLSDKLVQALDS